MSFKTLKTLLEPVVVAVCFCCAFVEFNFDLCATCWELFWFSAAHSLLPRNALTCAARPRKSALQPLLLLPFVTSKNSMSSYFTYFT